MKKTITTFAIIIYIASLCFGMKNESKDEAKILTKKGLEALGGEEKLRSIAALEFEGIGHTYAVEQSERPEGPFIVIYNQIKETRDLKNNYLSRTTEMKQGQSPEWSGLTMIVNGDFAAYKRGEQTFPGRANDAEDARMKLALAPERIFLTALESSDLRLEKPAVIQKVKHNVIKFTWKNIPVTVYLNADTNLPTLVETLSASPFEHFWSVWGDFTTRTFYSYWTLEQGGIHYPHQSDVFRNEYPLESFTITDLKFNETPDAKTFEIPEETKKMSASIKATKIDDLPLGIPNRPSSEVAPGIIEIPGRWDIAFVKQTDGIVIIEAPISSGYSAKAIEEAKKRFPSEKIKAVITTSDAFPHLGGIREYAAQEIPIYALDLNRSILEKVIKSPHKFYPDNLQRNYKNPKFNFVSEKTVIGKGDDRLEIFPIRSESGERMMMIYFPAHKLLYSSDLINKSRDGGFFMPQYLSEIVDAVKRENLAVDNIFGMHISKTAWSEIVDAVNKQTAETSGK